MKRPREEAHVAAVSPVRRPQAPRADLTGPPTMATASPAGGNQRLSTEDALTYLKDVKKIFENDKEKYDEFLEVMRDFKSQRINTGGVIDRVKELFKGHRRLILGFNAFLPKGYEITLPPEEKKPVEFEQAIDFVNRIKTRFQGADHVYKSFLNILNMYRNQSKSIQQVYNEVSLLFHNHKDFLDEFTHFLPEVSGLSHHHGQSGRSYVPRDDKSYVKPVVKAEQADHLRDKAYASRLDHDLSVDRPDLEHENQRRRPDREKSRQDEKDRRDHDRDDKHLVHENREIDSMQNKRKPSRRVDDVVEHFPRGESKIGVYSVSASPYNGENDLRSVYTQEFTFCEKVKERLSPSAYQEFLRCLDIYSKEIVTRTDLKNLVSDILGKYTDLMNGFDEFLAHCENIDGFLANVINKKHQPRSTKPEDQNMDKESDMKGKGKERDYEKEREKDWDRFGSRDTDQKVPLNREKCDFYKPIAELDLSGCERSTPSYRLLPKNYPILPSSHRSEIGASVLNDFWVSVTSGSEDYSFKHMRKNQYEESLFRCEDDRFEMDMLLESVNAAIRRVEDLIEKMQDNDTLNSDTPVRIEDYLTALNLRCIERLYGDHGLDVMDVLRKNPSLALPVILTRLIQKQEEWSRCRSDFNKVWAEVYAKNYHKSLDHRSFYFKQQDMKNLATKALLTEIKEMNEKRREDDMLLAVAAGNRWPTIPNMQFDFTDSDIHEDIYGIIKYSCREVCSSVEQVNKVMRIWTTLVDVILGTSRSHGREDSEDAMKSAVRNVCGNDVGTNGSRNTTRVIGENKPRNPGSKFGEGIKAMEVDSCHDIFADGEMAGHQGGFCNPDGAPRGDDITSGTQVQGKSISVSTPETISKVRNLNICTELLGGNHSLSLMSQHDVCAVPLKTYQSGREIMSQHQQTIDAPRLSEGCDNVMPGSCANEVGTVERTGMLKHRHGFVNLSNFKAEREEGELSPNGVSEEDDSEGFDGPSRDRAIPFVTDVPNAAAAANDPDANDDGEESTQRSTESEDASGDREDTSSSISGDADECLHEDNAEDVDQDDLNTKAESEGEAEELADAHGGEGEGISVPPSDNLVNMAKPLARHMPSALHDKENKGSHIFYGNDTFYVFFRLHQVLYERMLTAKSNSASSEKKWKNVKDVGSLHLYEKFKSALYNFLDGSADSTKFEDECRATIGTQSYVLFTLDKLVYKIVKQLQGIALDETCNKLLQLHVYEKSRKPGRFSDLGYYEDARVFLHDENIYRFETSFGSKKFSIQLMECGYEKTESTSVFMDPSFATYLYNDFLSVVPHGKDTDSVFLESRNKRKNESHGENCATWDDYDRIVIYNGLECKLSFNTSKISYVLDTEDLFYRKKRRKLGGSSSCYHQGAAKVENFHRFLSRWHGVMTT